MSPAGGGRALGSRPGLAVRPAWAWTEEGLVRAPVLAWDGAGRLAPHRGEPIRDIGGIVLPGLINAHTHLELGPMATPPALGLCDWVRWLRASVVPSATQAGRGVCQAVRTGTAAVLDIGNTGLSAGAVEAAGLSGLLFHEVIGLDREDLPPSPRGPGGEPLRPTPHAPYSCSPALMRACADRPGPWSIHLDEDPAERELLATGGGPWAAFLRAMGRDLSRWQVPATTPARYLDGLGLLSKRSVLVHATLTEGEDLDLLAERGCPVVLCPRSNLHITGRLPDVPGMLARGIRLAVGTDSLASSPDLDVLAEAAVLRARFPKIPLGVWLRALTAGGADAMELPLGRIAPGAAPGLLHLDVPDGPDVLERLLDGTPWRRRWLAMPGVMRGPDALSGDSHRAERGEGCCN